ncbi:MAG: hypothetical protein AAF251_06475 [Pseudomonadota bacterium]
MKSALSKGSLTTVAQGCIALATGNYNGCGYCDSARAYFAKNIARLDEAETAGNCTGRSTAAKSDPAVQFTLKAAEQCDSVTDADIAAVRLAGFSDVELVEKDREVPQNADLCLSVPLASIMALAFGLMIILATESVTETPEAPAHVAANNEAR